MSVSVFLLTCAIAVVLLGTMIVMFLRRKKQEQAGAEKLRLALAEGQTVPLSLHPVIDPVLCVGSFSCIKSCPEGEIIGVVDGVATLVEAAHCIGHGRCAVECPVGAIKLVFGTAEMGVHLPKTDDNFESSREGVYIVGELGGMGLIKNALRQGLVLGKTLKTKLKKSEATNDLTDVVVVGGGPAGVATAVACRQNGLDVRILEQDSLGGCIAHYPRGKVVMTEQIEVPGYGRFGRSLLSKEELLEEMRALVNQNKITIEEGNKVVGIQSEGKYFLVTTANEATVLCRSVVLAIGLRGTPRKLGVPGEDLPKVVYRLIEPEQYHKKRVLIVGGGDSAVEAAIQLAEESTAKVAISYRQGSFSRCKQRNKDKIKRLIEEGRVKAYMKTRVLSIEDGLVRLTPMLDEKEEKKKKQEPVVPVADVTDPEGTPTFDELQKAKAYDRKSVTASFRAVALPISMEEEAVEDKETTLTERPEEFLPPAPVEKTSEKKLGKSSASQAPVSNPSIKRIPNATSSFKRVGSIRKPVKEEKPKEKTKPKEREPEPEFMAPMPPTVADVPDERPRVKTNTSIQVSTRIRTIEGKASQTMSSSGKVEREDLKLKNDAVIVSIGGQLPTEFLEAVGVGTRKYHGEEKSGFGARPGKGAPSKATVEARSRRRLAMILFLLGISIIVGLVMIGQEYYWLPDEMRATSPLHSLLKPSGLWGHGVGVGATLFMLANFLYAVRKRWRRLKGTASIRTWLTLHMFVGIMSPLVIAFHAAFLVNNLLAVWTWIALSVVVGTGIFGRFLFGFVPAQAGKVLQVSELREQVGEMTRVIQTHMAESADFGRVNRIFDRATEGPKERTFVGAVLRETRQKDLEVSIAEARPLFKSDEKFKLYKESVEKVARAKMQIQFYGTLKRIFRGWLVIHVVVSVFMVLLIGAHVTVTTYLGFRWIFSEGSQ